MNAPVAPNLFEHRARFPDHPGYRNRDTSKAAALDMRPRQGTIQAAVLAALERGPLASFELAAVTGISYRSVQPRTSELSLPTEHRPALIRDSGERRVDPSTSKNCIVWELVR